MKPQFNNRVAAFRCLSCNNLLPVADYFEGCPDCRPSCQPSSVAPVYNDPFPALAFETIPDWLTYSTGPILGEGNTPMVRLDDLAHEIGVAGITIKNEGANPTGSHKDRMSAMVVQRALDIGANTVAAASSGNAGASLAAYAARAGLGCVVVTTPKMLPGWRRAIKFHGGQLIATEIAEERWQLMAARVRDGDWYPATNHLKPPVGSNPFGVDGYRAIAFELFLQSNETPPTDILVPTSRGDVLWGIARGYADLSRAGYVEATPRIHAVEPFPRISRVLEGSRATDTFPGTSQMVSIGGDTVALQALDALSISGGTAVAVREKDVLEDQRRLSRCGLYLELSSAAALTGLRNLLGAGQIAYDANVCLIATSHGYKEPASYDADLPTSAVVECI